MTVTIAPVGLPAASAVTLPSLPTVAGAGDGAAAGPSFGSTLGDAVAALQDQHTRADLLAEAGITGQLTDGHDYTIAATQAQLATDLTVAVRNRALEAFTSIMTMPV